MIQWLVVTEMQSKVKKAIEWSVFEIEYKYNSLGIDLKKNIHVYNCI